mmetsp:Transcript_102128/g.243560  ORF Transcript_102128/g.243560 Transcript_102128/m.243560 type:complete len:541 (+) Transcript_102128:57-1679(+)
MAMRFFLFIVALGSQPNAVAAISAEGVVLMQSRLRGSKTTETSGETSITFDDSGEISADSLAHGARYSDDDESCTAEGLSPGVCALTSLARPRLVKTRLRKSVADCDEEESRARLERALVAEIESGLAGNHSAFDGSRLQKLEEDLRPLYATLPHEYPLADIEGGLGLSSARYLLHQYFLRQHSWYVRGLNPAGDGRQPPDHKEALRSRVAGHLLQVLEQKVGSGLNLKTLTVFVATLEHLLHGDERQRLKQSWSVHDLNMEDVTDAAGLESVLEVFMAHYVFVSQKADSGYALTLEKGREEVAFVNRVYEGWGRIRDSIASEIQKRVSASGSDLSFDDAAAASEKVLESFREVSGSMCASMARSLAALPGGADGKVGLAAMRKGDLFRETTEYLRMVGALDEQSPSPMVLVPNYMLSPSNCDGTTSFYDLCCPNTCEGHKAQFEAALAEGREALEAITALAAEIRGKPLPAARLKALEDLTEDGSVMVHGRQFAQWLHETFPGDCPRPLAEEFPSAEAAVPDSHREFQKAAQVESLFEW